MRPTTTQDQIVQFLSDMYSVELQALAQLVSAPKLAGDDQLADDFRTHHAETEQQAAEVRQRLEELGGSPSMVKDAIMKLGGKSFVLFAKLQLETPGRLLAHAYSYEAMEWAGYGVLGGMAEAMEDTITAQLARNIQLQERTMMDRLERCFDAVEARAHRNLDANDLQDHVRKHLAEVHAFECQSVELLEKARSIAGDPELERLYQEHLKETQEQKAAVERRLHALDAKPSLLQDAALRLGALNWGLFFQVQSDTPAKLAAFAYAVEHLEIGAYELLTRAARRLGDGETQELCQRIVLEERAMTNRVAEHLDLAVRATLAEVESRH